MKMRPYTFTAALTAIVLASAVAAADAPLVASFAGEAFGTDGRLRYVESHAFEATPSGVRQVTIYRDPGGRQIGRMEADYGTYRFAPEYRMVDLRHDTEEIVRRDGSQVHVEVRRGDRVRSKTLQLSGERELIVGPGFNEFIKANWDTLLSGRTLVCDFVVPSRLQAVAFRIRHTPDGQSSRGYRFTVSVDNAFLRLLAPELVVEYDRQTRALLAYDGLSNVNDERNKSQTVAIRFPAVDPMRSAASAPSGSQR
jgi:hypothetical protein